MVLHTNSIQPEEDRILPFRGMCILIKRFAQPVKGIACYVFFQAAFIWIADLAESNDVDIRILKFKYNRNRSEQSDAHYCRNPKPWSGFIVCLSHSSHVPISKLKSCFCSVWIFFCVLSSLLKKPVSGKKPSRNWVEHIFLRLFFIWSKYCL